MRFLYVCVAILSGLVAVRCLVLTNELEAQILRWVMVNNKKWQVILLYELEPKEIDSTGEMLAELNLTPKAGAGITLNKIVQQLITREGVTGTQLRFGMLALNIALMNQFMITLMVHAHLTSKYVFHKYASPADIQICISKIQVSLVNFIRKAPIVSNQSVDFFVELINDINVFFANNKTMLESQKINMKEEIRKPIMEFLEKLVDAVKEKVKKVSYTYKTLDDTEIRRIMENLKLRLTHFPKVIDKSMDRHDLFSMATYIDDYEYVKFDSCKLDMAINLLKITEYLPDDEISESTE